MRTYFNDFHAYTRLADGSMQFGLAEEGRDPTFGELQAGERVLLVFPGELMAIATVRGPERVRGLEREHVYWVAIVSQEKDIVRLPLTEPYAGYPVGYDGQDLWAELAARDAQLKAERQQTAQDG